MPWSRRPTDGGEGGDRHLIRLRLTVEDLQRMRFEYSPPAEVTESLYAVRSGQLHIVHRGWAPAGGA